MSRLLLAAVATALLALAPSFAGTAFAQETRENPETSTAPRLDLSPTFINTLGPAVRLADFDPAALEQIQVPIQRPAQLPVGRRGTSRVLAGLYASTAIVQALDTHSTLRALDRGAVEGNPLLAGVSSNKAAFVGVKAAVAVGTIYATRELAKKNKVAAILTLVAINSVYAYAAHHNYQVARGR